MRYVLRFVRIGLVLSPLCLIGCLLWLGGQPAAEAAPAPAATLRYVANSGADSGTCNVAATPCKTIQFAVDKAAANDTVLVAQGVYTQTNVRPRNDIVVAGTVTQVAYISKSLTIKGGYTTTNNFASSLPLTQTSTIDAQNKGRGFYIVNSAGPTLEDLRITNGNAANMGGHFPDQDAGGGIYIFGGGLNFLRNTIVNNTAEAGGGVYVNNAICLFCSNNAIVTNTATISGGGVYVFSNQFVALWYNDISGNQATKGGGGVSIDSSGLASVEFSTINRNTSGNTGGGGIRVLFSDGATVSDNTLMQNSTGGGNAGAVFIERSNANVSNNKMISNSAGLGGAMYIFFSGSATVNGNVIRGNTASINGGGVFLHSTNLLLVNNAIVDNRLTGGAGKGSGIHVQEGAPRLTHNTLARNTGGDGSALYLVRIGGSAFVVMTDTIIVSHSIGISTSLPGTTATVRGVLWFGNGVNAVGNVNPSSQFTGTPDFLADGYHIGSQSTAIDKGLSNSPTTDIDGDARPFGPKSDIGADELPPTPDIVASKVGPTQFVTPTVSLPQINWIVSLTNVGTLTATNTWFTDTPPVELKAFAVNGAGGCNFFSNAVSCMSPTDIAPGAVVTFTVKTNFVGATPCNVLLVNNLVATSDGELNTANNNHQAQTQFICNLKLYLPLIMR